MRDAILALALAGCASTPPHAAWPTPAGWRTEQIAFPLPFAPALHHRGHEDIRFPPGFLDPASPNHWSYVFTWTIEPAELDAAAEMTAYFRGLLVEVDGDRHRFDPAAITVTGTGVALHAHIFDAFGSGAALDLDGTVTRTACGWTFVFAPARSPLRSALDALAAQACPRS